MRGLPEEHPDVMGRIGMTPQQLIALQHATALTWRKLSVALAKAGKYIWQQFKQATFSRSGCTR